MLTQIFKTMTLMALLAFPIAVILTRYDIVHFRLAFLLIAIGVVIAVIVVFLGFVIGFVKSGPYVGTLRMCALISLVPIAFMGLQFYQATSVPSIHNISTDIETPPEFDAVLSLRGAEANPVTPADDQVARLQRAAYPDIKPLRLDATQDEIYAASLKVANDLGWEVVSADSERGHIEAVDTTRLWRFKDDVAIRIRDEDLYRQLDIRSVSRVGKSDLGANAKRIRKFITALQANLD